MKAETKILLSKDLQCRSRTRKDQIFFVEGKKSIQEFKARNGKTAVKWASRMRKQFRPTAEQTSVTVRKELGRSSYEGQ